LCLRLAARPIPSCPVRRQVEIAFRGPGQEAAIESEKEELIRQYAAGEISWRGVLPDLSDAVYEKRRRHSRQYPCPTYGPINIECQFGTLAIPHCRRTTRCNNPIPRQIAAKILIFINVFHPRAASGGHNPPPVKNQSSSNAILSGIID
jgi:hypothetical protein